jgi:predicted transcriptional regulator
MAFPVFFTVSHSLVLTNTPFLSESVAMHDKEIRERILDELYKRRDTMSVSELIKAIPVSETELSTNIIYLKDKGFIEAHLGAGMEIVSAKITPRGINIIERNK